MAYKPCTIRRADWHHLMAERSNLTEALSGPDHRKVEESLAAIEEQLLDAVAPYLPDVLLKLELLWAHKLDGDDSESRHRRCIVEDLRRLVG